MRFSLATIRSSLAAVCRSSNWRPSKRSRRSIATVNIVEAGGLMSYGTNISDA